MARYKKKQTQLMEYDEFKSAISDLPIMERAFLTFLFFTGCRVSEAIAIISDDFSFKQDTIFVLIYRLKGSKQTDALQIPRIDALEWICQQRGRIFPFSRYTANRIVKKAFPEHYPHFFRMNFVTKVLDKYGIVVAQNVTGLTLNSLEHYVAKLDIKRISKVMLD